MKFAQFMARPLGRGLRIIAGIALVLLGALALLPAGESVWGWVLIAVGAVFVAVGAINVCALARLFGGPFSGRKALAADRQN